MFTIRPPLGLAEGQDTVQVDGHTWAMAEVKSRGMSGGGREPPVAVTQHSKGPRQIVVLSAQGSLILSPFR